MKRKYGFILSILLFLFVLKGSQVYAMSQKIFDDAGILSETEVEKLESLSKEIGSKWDTDILIVTANDPSIDVKQYTEDFYDEKIEEQGLKKWNVAMLTLDMSHREVYLAGFYKGKLFLNDQRLDTIREQITPALSAGNYSSAFEQFMKSVDRYMAKEPANIFYQWWFQIIIAVVLSGLITGVFVYHSGGRVTVNNQTYLDTNTSRILDSRDEYIRTVVTKRKNSSQNSDGGGTTSGGHSHSGSHGSF